MNREINIIETYKGFKIAHEIMYYYKDDYGSEIEYSCYYVLDENNLPIGGSLLNITTCKKWIDILEKEKR